MRRSAANPQPAAGQIALPIWRGACVLWRTLMAAVCDPYRPEHHYMRGPGPRCRERQDRSGATERGT
jgi:hypothetical protein